MLNIIERINDICPECEAERDLQYVELAETINIRGEEITVPSRQFYCPAGNHYFESLEDGEEKIQHAYREYRNRKGLLQPEEIKALRKKYNLSQRDLAQFLDFGEITIQRYESGAIQNGSHNDSMVSIQEVDTYKVIFKRKKNNLPNKLVIKIENNLRQIDIDLMNLAFAARERTSSRETKSKVGAVSLKKEFECHDLISEDFSKQAREELALAA
jgi:putative zinc finger/helix-turn-helix YgiT family protein